MVQSQRNIVAVVEELLTPTVTELGYTLWDVEFVKEGARFYLRLTIDSENGIGIDDCEKVHRAIDPILDEADPIEPSYCLEVSSPGIERVLKKAEHFVKMMGEEIVCKLYRPQNGTKTVQGILQGYDADTDSIQIQPPQASLVCLQRKEIAKANVVFAF